MCGLIFWTPNRTFAARCTDLSTPFLGMCLKYARHGAVRSSRCGMWSCGESFPVNSKRDCIPLFMKCVSHLKPWISSFSFLFHAVVEKLTSNSCSCLAKMARLRKFWFCRWLQIMHKCNTTIQSHFCRKTRVRCGGMFNGKIFPCDVGFYVQQYKFEQARLIREWLLPWFPCCHCRCHLQLCNQQIALSHVVPTQ